MRRPGVLVLLALLLPLSLSAQETPEAAAEAFGATVRTGDWAGAARLMHPQALKQLHDLFVPLVTSPKAGDLATQLFGVSSPAELASTPDTVLFAHFLGVVMSQQEGLVDALRGSNMVALGHVMASGDTVLVVSRLSMAVEGITISSFDVMPFLLYQGHYRGLLKTDFTNMAEMLKARLGKQS